MDSTQSEWSTEIAIVSGGVVRLTFLDTSQHKLSFDEFFQLLSSNESFCHFFNHALANIPFNGFYWELPAITASHLADDFECVVIGSDAFSHMEADWSPFSEHFKRLNGNNDHCVTFANLSGDAYLISPTPHLSSTPFPHLAYFVRNASTDYVIAVWRGLAKEVSRRAGEIPLWISTSGLGVHWLHIRLDRSPKYYQFAPYRHG